MSTAHSPRRLSFFSITIIFFAAILIARLYYIQIHSHERYTTLSQKNTLALQNGNTKRGVIFFKDKDNTRVPAALNTEIYTLAIDPKKVTDPEAEYNLLSNILPDLSSDTFLNKAAKHADPYEEILKNITPDIEQSITNLNLPGVRLYPTYKRSYPYKDLGARVLGFVGYSKDTLTGQYGVERYYNDILSPNKENTAGDSSFLSLLNNVFKKDTHGDVVLTIEPEVQKILKQKLEETENTWHSDVSGGIIMDPKTGRIIAMDASPSYDLNEYNKVKDVSVFNNPLVQNVYEMGSIMKPLTVAAGIDAQLITASTTYNDVGHVEIDGRTISNFDKRGRGIIPIQEVLNQSLNTGVVFIVNKLGRENFIKYMNAFGLSEETGIDLPGESSPLAKNLSSTVAVDYTTAAFGQGIAVTPIAVTRALAALANNGKLVTPYITDSIDYHNGNATKSTPNEMPQVITKETADEITRMLITVVDKALLGGEVKLDHYSIAAKTGTAQIADEKTKGYFKDRYLHTFFGYFPAHNPRFIIFLYTVYPKGAEYASHTLTYPFIDLVKFLIQYYEIPEDR